MDPMWDKDLIDQIKEAKKNVPEKFISHWEFDENNIDFASQKDIENKKDIRFLWAAENDKIAILQELHQKYPNLINIQDSDGYSPLHRAVYNDNCEIALYLLDNGANINSLTKSNWTPLHSAVHWKHLDMVVLLIQHGADVNAKTSSNVTPIHLACSSDNREIIECLLLQEGIDLDVKSNSGDYPIDLCKRHNRYSFLFDMHNHNVQSII
ncbi:Ankyrin repeat domain-containing protein 49 [Intoshia linei]|uniref:Ankyrin repeat domain-containing protein 49 n=1 Tax=Intoshia linei TaxID=1819745 RepID=A0A177BCB3_9BILA|nr:Ankyrin repeat domain-containing protein 49 [Intoshia linei]